jgi:carbamate kinase
MLPKVQAALSFVTADSGERAAAVRRTALITLLQKAKEGIEGKTGTIITR